MSIAVKNNNGKFLCGDYRQEKLVESFKVGDFIAHTCNSVSLIKEIINVSKCYTKFIVDSYDFDGDEKVLKAENKESRKYKNSMKIHFI